MKVESAETGNSACWSKELTGQSIGLDTGNKNHHIRMKCQMRMEWSPNYLAANVPMGTEWTVLWLQSHAEMQPAGKAGKVVCSPQQRLWLHCCHLTCKHPESDVNRTP